MRANTSAFGPNYLRKALAVSMTRAACVALEKDPGFSMPSTHVFPSERDESK